MTQGRTDGDPDGRRDHPSVAVVYDSLPLSRIVALGDPRIGEFADHLSKCLPSLRRLRSPTGSDRVNWGFVHGRLYFCWCLETFPPPKHHHPLRTTTKKLIALRNSAFRASRDPNLTEYQSEFFHMADEAVRISQTVNRQNRARYGGRRRRPGRPLEPMNRELAAICGEFKRALGGPQWRYFLELVKLVLPKTFGPEATIDQVRSRVNSVTKASAGR